MTDESYPANLAVPASLAVVAQRMTADPLYPDIVVTPDFTVTVRANLDPAVDVIAEGAAPGPAVETDYDHVRNWVYGMIQNIGGALPAGWYIDVEALRETRGQTLTPTVDPSRPVPKPVLAPDRMAAVEQAECQSCGMTLRRESADGIWYHVPDCADPRPPKTPEDAP
jgi:hypothetical protein